jgi:hypothetical protein
MAEFTYNPIQTVQPNQQVLLNTTIGCNKGYVLHREGSGIVTLRGIVNNPNACFARYQVTFNGNIAIPDGGTAAPIAAAITVSGEQRPTSRAIYTPAAADQYGNVTSTAIIDVPKGCCMVISVRYVSGITDGTATPPAAINFIYSNLVITRTA